QRESHWHRGGNFGRAASLHKSSLLFLLRIQRGRTPQQALCRFFSSRRCSEGLGAFSAIESRVDRSLPAGEALFSRGWLVGLGELEYLFIGQSSISPRTCDGGGNHGQKEGRGSAVQACRSYRIV